MVSDFALLSNLLLASAALAVPSSSPAGAPLAPSRETRQSSASNTQFRSNYAGSTWSQGVGTFTTITAAITVPDLLGDNGAASSYIGLESDSVTSCHINSFLRAGFEFSITDGQFSCFAWYYWFPEYYYVFPDLVMNANDTITISLVAKSTTTAQVFFQNQDTGQVAWHDYSAGESHALCEVTAAWAVSDTLNATSGTYDPLANFGTLIFNSASASDSSGVLFTPDGTTLFEIVLQNGTNLTATTAFGSTLLVDRL